MLAGRCTLTSQSDRRRVGVAGIGRMGEAVARTLLLAGHEVGVWNRTAGACRALENDGTKVTANFAGLVSEFPVLILVVRDYPVAMSLIEGIDLTDRLVIAGCSGPIGAAETMAAEVKRAGGAYLDLAIQTNPDQVGVENGLVVTSGDEASHERALPVLRSLGEVYSAGSAPCAANALTAAHGAYVHSAVVAGMEAAALFERTGGEISVLTDIMRRTRDNVEGVLRRLPPLADRELPPGRAIYGDIPAHIDALDAELDAGERLGVDLSMLKTAKRRFDHFAASEVRDSDLEQAFRLLVPATHA